MTLYDTPIGTLDGDPHPRAVRGKALLLVNVASKCGLTPQYEGSSACSAPTRTVAFPSSASPAISSWAKSRQRRGDQGILLDHLRRELPLMEKIEVNGENRHPLYEQLTEVPDAEGTAGDITWNFEKFLSRPPARWWPASARRSTRGPGRHRGHRSDAAGLSGQRGRR